MLFFMDFFVIQKNIFLQSPYHVEKHICIVLDLCTHVQNNDI